MNKTGIKEKMVKLKGPMKQSRTTTSCRPIVSHVGEFDVCVETKLCVEPLIVIFVAAHICRSFFYMCARPIEINDSRKDKWMAMRIVMALNRFTVT